MQFHPFEPGIECNGAAVSAVVEGFASFKKIPSDILLSVGIGEAGPNGIVELTPNTWFPLEWWLRGFERISDAIGAGALYGIGMKIPEVAIFPPWVKDIDSGLRSIDIAYHMNHRKRGKVMFDTDTGTMLEGIGHYEYLGVKGQKRAVMKCRNPYPCDFDKGIITSMARRFEPEAWVEHDAETKCRKEGGDTCTYTVTWR